MSNRLLIAMMITLVIYQRSKLFSTLLNQSKFNKLFVVELTDSSELTYDYTVSNVSNRRELFPSPDNKLPV